MKSTVTDFGNEETLFDAVVLKSMILITADSVKMNDNRGIQGFILYSGWNL